MTRNFAVPPGRYSPPRNRRRDALSGVVWAGRHVAASANRELYGRPAPVRTVRPAAAAGPRRAAAACRRARRPFEGCPGPYPHRERAGDAAHAGHVRLRPYRQPGCRGTAVSTGLGPRRCGRSPTGALTGQVGVADGPAYAHTGQRTQPASRTAASTFERSGRTRGRASWGGRRSSSTGPRTAAAGTSWPSAKHLPSTTFSPHPQRQHQPRASVPLRGALNRLEVHAAQGGPAPPALRHAQARHVRTATS